VVGDIVELAQRYCTDGADELVFYDITASPDGRTVDRSWVSQVARVIDIPFCVAGGIRSAASAEEVLNKGADKISINSPALANPELISDLATRFGSQCVVLGVDSQHQDGEYHVYQNTGDPSKTAAAQRSTMEWIREAQDRGAGEIVLNCMNQDGVREGYDCEQLALARSNCTVPLIASGGAGTEQHFADVFKQTNVDGALAASVFHDAHIHIAALKQFLVDEAVSIRL
jgi:cyclase